MTPKDLNGTHWFVMRDVLPSNAKNAVYKKLIEDGVEAFTPLRWEHKVRFNRTERVLTPVIYPLLFVHSSKAAIREMQLRYPTLQFIYQRGETKNDLGMVVSDNDMHSFRIAVEMQKSPVFYQLDEIKPEMIGSKVLMVNGPLKGCEGYLYKYRGRGHKLLVRLENYIGTVVQVKKEDFYIMHSPDDAQAIDLSHNLRLSLADLTIILDILGQKDVRALEQQELCRLHRVYTAVAGLSDVVSPSDIPASPSCQQMLQDIEREMTRRGMDTGTTETTATQNDGLLHRILSLCAQIRNHTKVLG